MSDLQCASRIILARHGEADALATKLAKRRVAHVYTSTLAPAVQSAQTVAAALGVAVTTRTELSAPTRLREVLAEISDVHRGETVLVISHGDVLRQLGSGELVQLDIDADGWVCRAWE